MCQANTYVSYEFNNLFAISNPRNVAPFAKGELADRIVSGNVQMLDPQLYAPNKRGTQASRKRPYTICSPCYANAVNSRFIFLAS
jgi:hypothetical protein